MSRESDQSPHRYRGPIVLLTCRDRPVDFRAPLADELAALGNEIYYVFLKRRPAVTGPGESAAQEMSFPSFVAFMIRLCRRSKSTLIFNSTNLAFPFVSAGLRALCGGLWCFDMHDDLLYDYTGWHRARSRIGLWVVENSSHLIVHGAPTLGELFPGSHHLGNASVLQPIYRERPDFSRVLIIASLDERFDFRLVASVAAMLPGKRFELFGRISRNDPAIAANLHALLAANPNIEYFGPYTDSDLPSLLARNPVMFAPYKMGSNLTRYIDPLRYYHCLNSGMEVVSTDIPQAHVLAEHLHIAKSAEEVCERLEAIARDPRRRRNSTQTANLHNWRRRAERLLHIVSQISPDPKRTI